MTETGCDCDCEVVKAMAATHIRQCRRHILLFKKKINEESSHLLIFLKVMMTLTDLYVTNTGAIYGSIFCAIGGC
jgi:hypothetical protein